MSKSTQTKNYTKQAGKLILFSNKLNEESERRKELGESVFKPIKI